MIRRWILRFSFKNKEIHRKIKGKDVQEKIRMKMKFFNHIMENLGKESELGKLTLILLKVI